MYKFVLKTKGGEVIMSTQADDVFIAEKFFSEMKRLEIKDLFKIFIIEQIIR